MIFDVVVVGAGAAGLMAAITAAGCGARTLLLERTGDGGRKILISGGGRCNVLPSRFQPELFVTDSSPNLMRRILRSWPLEQQKAFFRESLAMELALEEETGKLFPASNRARDVRDGLVRAVESRGGVLRFGQTVQGLQPLNGVGWEITTREGKSFRGRRIILATGGLSVAPTGSDGMGLRMAREMGHVIHPTYPALTPLLQEPPEMAHLAGVSLRVRLRAPGHGKRGVVQGGFLFTHRGFSGPTVLDLSHLAVRSSMLGVQGRRQALEVSWQGKGEEEWEAMLEPGVGRVLPLLKAHLPNRLAETLMEWTKVDAQRSLGQLTRDERRRLTTALAAFPLPWTGDEGYKKAEVTGGGVSLAEVDPGTLESRRHPGLHLCGEMLDAFGPIGGHNFLWAWTTGRAAGHAAAQAAI
ncbi:MAG: aminoacetone oxidase family FAD-binding enzyme [Gemmatimonadota bacterium]